LGGKAERILSGRINKTPRRASEHAYLAVHESRDEFNAVSSPETTCINLQKVLQSNKCCSAAPNSALHPGAQLMLKAKDFTR
jgi:hypothetical protein